MMPHCARIATWGITHECEAATCPQVFEALRTYGLGDREDACFAVLADQAGLDAYLERYPRDFPRNRSMLAPSDR